MFLVEITLFLSAFITEGPILSLVDMILGPESPPAIRRMITPSSSWSNLTPSSNK